MRLLRLFLTIAIISFFNSYYSQADVLIESGGINSFAAAGIPGVMQLDVQSGAGQAGDYILLTCGAFENSQNNLFNSPDPAIFSGLDFDSCGDNGMCISGIWGGFTNNPASENLACNTTGASVIFTAGALRYSNVDTMNPVIAIDCNFGQGNTATAPSIMTEAGSQVVRIFTSFAFTEVIANGINVMSQVADFNSEATVDGGQVSSIASSMFFNSDGNTGTAVQMYVGSPRDWRACTLALRMVPTPPTQPPPTVIPTPTMLPPPPIDRTSVPTLTQWGHLSVAILILLIGVWFYRKHKIRG
ncbi:MAG: hypothetical protein AAF462_08100 [Thermodesulfobacteriota bacterium]